MNSRYQSLRQLKAAEHPFAPYVRILGKGKTGSRNLSEDEAYTAMTMILAGEVEDVQLGAFLMLLRVKEETHQELKGFIRAVRDSLDPKPLAIQADLDWSSYAGKKRQLPWFILSACLLASHGIRIFMHGSAGHTIGRLYTQDVMAQLGLPVAENWSMVGASLDDHRFAYMPLSAFSSPLQHIIDLRNYLGLRSPVHTFSRQLNPLGAPHSVQSIFHPAYADHHQQTAVALGQTRAAVFKGEGGEVERKPEAVCSVKLVSEGTMIEEIWPKILSGRQQQPTALDVNDMTALWTGTHQSRYAETAIKGTAAIVLKLLGRANTQNAALNLADDLWANRNRDEFLPGIPAGKVVHSLL